MLADKKRGQNLPTEMGDKRLDKYVIPAGISNFLIQHGNDNTVYISTVQPVQPYYILTARTRSAGTVLVGARLSISTIR
jgi:hypothetical protein